MNLLAKRQGLTSRQLQMVDMEFEGKKKDKKIVLVLWLFFAGFGGHRFYLGDTGYAVAMMLLGWATLFIWPLVDIFFAWKAVDVKNEEIQGRIIDQVKLYDNSKEV